jgi:hypothetical protein
VVGHRVDDEADEQHRGHRDATPYQARTAPDGRGGVQSSTSIAMTTATAKIPVVSPLG